MATQQLSRRGVSASSRNMQPAAPDGTAVEVAIAVGANQVLSLRTKPFSFTGNLLAAATTEASTIGAATYQRALLC
jgi:hypothetical protein